MNNSKKTIKYEERRNERIDKGHRHKKHQRRTNESLRRIETFAKNFRDVDEYADEFDDLYEDE